MVQQKIQAFRDFAGQLAAQVVEQMCQEFEREVSQLWNDVLMYRGELDRVAQLLGAQLEREKKLHGVIETMVGHSQNVHQQAQFLANQRPGSDQLHQWLEQFMGQHSDIMNQTVAGVGQANQVLLQQAATTSQMKEASITAENEFVRIVNLLRQPAIPEVAPAPTVARIPGSVNMPPASAPQLGPPMPGGMYATPPPTTGQIMPTPGVVTPGPPSPGQLFGVPQRAPYVVMQAQPGRPVGQTGMPMNFPM